MSAPDRVGRAGRVERAFYGVVLAMATLAGIGAAAAWIGLPRVAHEPAMSAVVNPQQLDVAPTIDTFGRSVEAPPPEVAGASHSTEVGGDPLRPGDVLVDRALLELGRENFYRETFGNEVFLTDVMGILDGPIRPLNVLKAVALLAGRGTTNLEVELAQTVTIGRVTYREGETIRTGLDVPKGSALVLGMPIRVVEGKLKAGISCAVCHSTVDPESKAVIDGAVNTDFAAGLMLAMATNSAAYFPHAELASLEPFVRDRSRTVTTSNGAEAALPDVQALEAAVDEIFASWPPGSFDSTIDMKADPTQVPDSFTLGDHPYGWSGFAAVGPFRGLATLCNNVHAQNSDALAQADLAAPMFGIDKELYLAAILQNAANPKFRYDPASQQAPSAFFASVDPNPRAPGVNELVTPPNYPEISWIAPDGVFLASKGRRVWEQNAAMAAWQNTLVPPPAPLAEDGALAAHGRRVFETAHCSGCHSGPALTNNRIVPAPEIATEPTRALAFQRTELAFGPPMTWTLDTPVPVPLDADRMLVNMRGLDPHQLDLAWAHGGTPGGYKVPSLIGLWWSAPYLHDGGVAVGPNDEAGVAKTLLRSVPVDPARSLLAMIDRGYRDAVVKANDASDTLRRVRVRGVGHEIWVDAEAGFSAEDQRALVHYLLSYRPPMGHAPPRASDATQVSLSRSAPRELRR